MRYNLVETILAAFEHECLSKHGLGHCLSLSPSISYIALLVLLKLSLARRNGYVPIWVGGQ